MNEDTLMGLEIEEAMRAKVNEIMERKKNLTKKQTKVGKHVDLKQLKRRIEGVDPNDNVVKPAYMKELFRLTDRFVPRVMIFNDIGSLLNRMALDSTKVEKGVIKLKKTIEDENNNKVEIIIGLKILSYDENTDCFQFYIEKGNIYNLHDMLHEFDQIFLAG